MNERQYRSSSEVPVVPWEDVQDFFFRTHQQGESCSIVGPTGSGKSVLGLELCKLRARKKYKKSKTPVSVIVLATKKRDATLEQLDWPIVREWPPGYGQEACIIWPRPRDLETRAVAQRRVMRHVLNQIEDEGGHTVYIDEAAFFEENPPDGLGLSATMDHFWRESRSNGVTLIAGTQRPRHVSVSMWSEPAWLFAFRVEDEDDVKRVAGLSGQKQILIEEMPTLEGHEFVCVYRPRRSRPQVFRSSVELSSSRKVE